MDSNKRRDLLAESATQYRWAIANIVLALLCVVLAGGALMFGCVVADCWCLSSVLRWW